MFDPGLRAWHFTGAAAILPLPAGRQAASPAAAAPCTAAPWRHICLMVVMLSARTLSCSLQMVPSCATEHMPDTYHAVLLGLQAGMAVSNTSANHPPAAYKSVLVCCEFRLL